MMSKETTFSERGWRKGLCQKNLPTGMFGSRCLHDSRKANHMSRLRKQSQTIWFCKYHIVWCSKYRFRVHRYPERAGGDRAPL